LALALHDRTGDSIDIIGDRPRDLVESPDVTLQSKDNRLFRRPDAQVSQNERVAQERQQLRARPHHGVVTP
jgi:hypothetical protein